MEMGGVDEAHKRVMDGSRIKAMVEDRGAFAKYVDEKFTALDTSRDGKLSAEELKPVVRAIGGALGLPPQGMSKESDHIYNEVLGEFLEGKKGDSVSKEQFGRVLADLLLGVADGLERDPVLLVTLDGKRLREYVEPSEGHGLMSGEASFEVEAMGVFSQLQLEGADVGTTLKQALTKLPVQRGLPPVSDPQVGGFMMPSIHTHTHTHTHTHAQLLRRRRNEQIMKEVVEPSLRSLGVELDKEREEQLSQEEFLDLFRRALLAVASRLQDKPVTVAHTEKTFDGSTISTFLKNKMARQQTLDDTWASLESAQKANGALPKRDLRLGLDLIGPFAGLPPLGAVEEVDHVIDESFKLVDADEDGLLHKEEFIKCILEVLGGIMLQLQGKPIVVSSSVLANDTSAEDCLKL